MDFKCPECSKVVPSTSTDNKGKKQINSKFFPFCSERCKLIDMGAWFEGDYSIPAEEVEASDGISPEDIDF